MHMQMCFFHDIDFLIISLKSQFESNWLIFKHFNRSQFVFISQIRTHSHIISFLSTFIQPNRTSFHPIYSIAMWRWNILLFFSLSFCFCHFSVVAAIICTLAEGSSMHTIDKNDWGTPNEWVTELNKRLQIQLIIYFAQSHNYSISINCAVNRNAIKHIYRDWKRERKMKKQINSETWKRCVQMKCFAMHHNTTTQYSDDSIFRNSQKSFLRFSRFCYIVTLSVRNGA